MRRRTLLQGLAACLTLPALGRGLEGPDEASVALRNDLLAAMPETLAMTFYALKPVSASGQESWEGFRRTGSGSADPNSRGRGLELLRQGFTTPTPIARCFIPHHGVRLETRTGTYHVVICVTCALATVRRLPDGESSDYMPFQAELEAWNALFAASGVPLPDEDYL